MRLHYIPFTAYAELPLWDFRHTSEMIAEGRAVMEAYLATMARPQATWEHPWRRAVRGLRDRVQKASPGLKFRRL